MCSDVGTGPVTCNVYFVALCFRPNLCTASGHVKCHLPPSGHFPNSHKKVSTSDVCGPGGFVFRCILQILYVLFTHVFCLVTGWCICSSSCPRFSVMHDGNVWFPWKILYCACIFACCCVLCTLCSLGTSKKRFIYNATFQQIITMSFKAIADVITELKVAGSRKGVSRSAIKAKLPGKSAAVINNALKKAVATGKLTQSGDSFKVC